MRGRWGWKTKSHTHLLPSFIHISPNSDKLRGEKTGRGACSGVVEGRRHGLLCGASEEAARAFSAWDSVFTLLKTGCAQFLSPCGSVCVPREWPMSVFAPFHSGV